jgi:glycosyltransferase involved in cell wall biosynthesis
MGSSESSLQVTILAEELSQEQPSSSFQVSSVFTREGDYPAQVMKHVKTLAPDILHIQHEYGIFGFDDRFFRLLVQLRNLGVRTVVTLHTVHTGLSFHAGCTRPQMRRLLRKVDIEKYQHRIGELVDLVIVHQENSIRQVLLRQGLSPQRVVTVPHGTRVLQALDKDEAKAALGVKANTPLILAFGYLEPSKNLLVLIEAFRRVKARIPSAKLWLGGYVRFPMSQALAYRRRCLRLIEAHGLGDSVIFSDMMVPEEHVPRVLAAADVACFIYDEDTHSSSGALHLAMGLGTPVVASRIPKFQELAEVSDEVLVNPRSTGELYRLLTRLLLDEPFRFYVKQRVRSYAQRTAWSSVARQHAVIYSRLVSVKRPAISRCESFNKSKGSKMARTSEGYIAAS